MPKFAFSCKIWEKFTPLKIDHLISRPFLGYSASSSMYGGFLVGTGDRRRSELLARRSPHS